MKTRIDLLQGNIVSTLTKLALPIMGMSLLQMAYNLTDIFWIGKLGAGAVASVGTGGLLLWFSAGVHMLAQVGGQVYVGQSLGAGNVEKAGKYAHASLSLSGLITVLLGFVFYVFADQIVAFFNLNDAQVILDAKYYIQITGGLIIFSLGGKMITSLITVTGDSKTPFIATMIGLIFNMILDPILIFGYFGFPQLGVVGAALATVLAQFIVFVILIMICIKDKHLFSHVQLFVFPDKECVKQIMKLSFPVMLQNTLMPLISMVLSRLVANFGDNAVATQRIGSQIESISWMVSEGFAVAVNSFIAQNYGANNFARAKKGFYMSIKILAIYSLFSTSLLIFGAKPLFSIFLNEPEVLKMGISYLQILGVSQLFMCMEILSSTSMNAFGKSAIPAFISVTFTALRIPMAIILSASALALSGIWWSITISSIFKGLLMLLAILFYLKRLSNKICYKNN